MRFRKRRTQGLLRHFINPSTPFPELPTMTRFAAELQPAKVSFTVKNTFIDVECADVEPTTMATKSCPVSSFSPCSDTSLDEVSMTPEPLVIRNPGYPKKFLRIVFSEPCFVTSEVPMGLPELKSRRFEPQKRDLQLGSGSRPSNKQES